MYLPAPKARARPERRARMPKPETCCLKFILAS
jgi:hypothetical protein